MVYDVGLRFSVGLGVRTSVLILLFRNDEAVCNLKVNPNPQSPKVRVTSIFNVDCKIHRTHPELLNLLVGYGCPTLLPRLFVTLKSLTVACEIDQNSADFLTCRPPPFVSAGYN